MQQNHSVRHLDFSDNAIGGGYEKTQRIPGGATTGGASIALALGVNSTLRRIDLQWNLLGSKVDVSHFATGTAVKWRGLLTWIETRKNNVNQSISRK